MNTRVIWLFYCAAALLIVSAASLSSDTKLEPIHAKAVVKAVFSQLDCEMDGTIDPWEVDDHFAQLWHPIDRDQSRALSKYEYARTHRSVPDNVGEALFRDADANADNQISANELRKHMKRMILMVDSDGDREVTLTDVGLKPLPTLKNNPFVTAKSRAEGS